MEYYLIRIGEGSKYVAEARKEGFVAIGWNKVPDLNSIKSVKQIKSHLEKSGYGYSSGKVSSSAGQLFRFAKEIQEGDYVISPLGGGEYLAGIVGEYLYEAKPSNTCPYSHRRKVKWLDQILLKEDMSTNLSYSVGALLTVFSISKYAKEIDALIEGRSFTPADKPQRVRDAIQDSLLDMDGKQFEKFIQHLLEIIGFQAETTQYVGDKGIDVNGILNVEGIADITLRVQVKRVAGSISNKIVLGIRGALSQGEHGCIITTSTFTSKAVEEAEASGKVPIKLIDGSDLAGMILRHYDELDDQYKSKFQIRRKKDFNIEDQFEIGDSDVVSDDEINITHKDKKPDWDTLVCSAKEDGFKYAFLDQKAWWAVRLSEKYIPHIKYLAMYQVAPVSKITYYGEVDKIEPFEGDDSGKKKYKLFLKNDPIKLKTPVGLGKNPHIKPQGPKYAELDKIINAKTLDDVWS